MPMSKKENRVRTLTEEEYEEYIRKITEGE